MIPPVFIINWTCSTTADNTLILKEKAPNNHGRIIQGQSKLIL